MGFSVKADARCQPLVADVGFQQARHHPIPLRFNTPSIDAVEIAYGMFLLGLFNIRGEGITWITHHPLLLTEVWSRRLRTRRTLRDEIAPNNAIDTPMRNFWL